MSRKGLWRGVSSALHLAALLVVCGSALAQPAGTLRTVGGYPVPLTGHTVTPLPDGTVLAYGVDPIGFNRRDGQRVMTLRNRRDVAATDIPFRDALAWDPQKRAWKKVALPPECAGSAYLHTATALPDGKVLIAGGLCDRPRMADDPAPHPEYTSLSLWNGATGGWESAPYLFQGRIYHSATLMKDGSVVFLGGESDPALRGADAPVLDSVEAFQNGKVVRLAPLRAARARHTATLLADGSLLVAGGFDQSGNAIPAVEIRDPVRQSWSAAPPLETARYAHTATLLDDGRVLVAGGVDRSGRRLASVEIWQPGQRAWTSGIALPTPVHGHTAVLLKSGDVLVAGGLAAGEYSPEPWAVLRDKATGEWKPAGSIEPQVEYQAAQKVTFWPHDDGTVHVFTLQHVLQWSPGVNASDAGAPVLLTRPALAALNDGRVMLAARTSGGTRGWAAHIWNPKDDSWSEAGRLAYNAGRHTQAIQLQSGRVLHLGFNEANKVTCELWRASDNTWEACGELALKYQNDTPWGLGLLGDGRAVLMPNSGEAFIFSEKTKTWTPAAPDWNYEGLTYGAPIRLAQPLARIFDEEKKEWLDVSDVASRLWQSLYPRRRQAILIGGKVPEQVEGRGAPPSLLWDSRKQHWAYIFLDKASMGIHAQFLPDGCALSWTPFTVFDPRTGKVTPLPDPGTGIATAQGGMVVLADGTVVIAGTPAGATGAGRGFFHRKASCAGFEALPGDGALMPAVLHTEGWVGQAAAPTAPLPKPAPAVSWQGRVSGIAHEYRWIILAVLGPIALYLLLSRLILPPLRAGFTRALPKEVTTSLKRELPKPFAWGTRIVVYGIAAAVFLVLLVPYLNFRRATTPDPCEENPAACINPRTGLLKGAGSKIPCLYVGVWSSRQKGKPMFRITLKDDGTYVAAAGESRITRERYTGFWAMQGENMVWRHDSAPTRALDVNRILPESDTRFTLVEENGSRTEFELIERAKSSKCAP